MRRLCLALLLAVTPLHAAEDATTLARQAAEALRVSVDALQAAEGAKDRVSALTQTIGAYELGLSVFRDSLRGAAIREAEIEQQFEGQHEKIGRILAAMTAMQETPGPLVLIHPDGPEAAVRSGLILSSVVPALRAEADVLKRDLAEVQALRTLRAESASVLQEGLEAAQRARTALSQAMQDRVDLPTRFLEDPEELRTLVAGSETLDAFAIALGELETDIGPPMEDFAAARGSLSLPVLGRVLRLPGEADAAGIRRPGIVLATGPNALVTTPWAATIRYRGPLLDYGNVMVLEPAKGYLLVLAGLGTVYGAPGDVLGPGAPVGLMPGEELSSDAALATGSETGGAGRTETLYVELRQDGEPLDLAEWFAATRG